MTFNTHTAVSHNETLTNGTQKTLLVGANDIVIEQTADSGGFTLSNLKLQYSLDNTNWFRSSDNLTLEEQSSTKYVLAHRIENISFRYVRLEVIAVYSNPTTTTLSISRSL